MKNYAAWLAEAGFAAERITSVEELERYPLLVLSGGGDMTPGSGAFQGEVDESRLRYPKPERDELELALLASARERKMPVLGICRGMQVLNVACGGTLWPDISDGGFETVDVAPPDRFGNFEDYSFNYGASLRIVIASRWKTGFSFMMP
mgnify:CR=1 FL=1